MNKAGQETPEKLTWPDYKTRELRAKLILEEAFETIDALGVDVYIKREDDVRWMMSPECFDMDENTLYVKTDQDRLEHLSKELADLNVVNNGTAIACGIPIDTVQEAVDQNNLDKFGPGHSYREDGKLIKPPGFKKPDIGGILNEL